VCVHILSLVDDLRYRESQATRINEFELADADALLAEVR